MATTCREVTPPARVHHRLHKAAGRWGGEVDDSELDVFAAERYFNGDDALSSSSSFSSAFRTHKHGLSSLATVTAATSSSEASWNSRSALLPDGKVATAAPGIEAEPRASKQSVAGGKSPAPSSSHLRRWMLGVAGCACIGVVGGEQSVSTDDDEVEDDQELIASIEAGEVFGRRGESKEEFLAVGEATSVRVMQGRFLDDGDAFLAGTAPFSPVQLAGDGHRRAANSAQLSTPPFFNSATTATSHEQELAPHCHKKWSSLVSTTPPDSAFTIVAGNTAHGGGLHAVAAAGVESPAAARRPCMSRRDSSEDELGCAYPPSEVSVVWSVATAEGAASCNFSSAASGYYYHHQINPAGEDDDARRRNRRRRRRSGAIANSGGGLLTCIGDKAVDTVGTATVGARRGGRNGART